MGLGALELRVRVFTLHGFFMSTFSAASVHVGALRWTQRSVLLDCGASPARETALTQPLYAPFDAVLAADRQQ